MIFECFTACVTTVMYPYNVYVCQVKCYFCISRMYKLVLKSAIDLIIVKRFFLCIVFQVAQNNDHANTSDKYYFHPVVVLHALYNVKLSYKHENVL